MQNMEESLLDAAGLIKGCFLPNHLALCICAGGNLQQRVCATDFHSALGMGHPEFDAGDTVTTLFRAQL